MNQEHQEQKQEQETQTQEQDQKICRMCKIVKNVNDDFYNIGLSKSKYCKPCHNKNRKNFKVKKQVYKPRPKKSQSQKKSSGFKTLSKEIQEDIIHMLNVKYTKKEIHEKYKEHFKYQTFLRWGRMNQY
jgi:hypothetical protein